MSRTFSRATPLGQRMDVLGFTVRELRDETGIDRWRLNDYLFDRKPISATDMQRLCMVLKCSPEAITSPNFARH